jgi:putative FmdB family regulatory protein
MPIREYECKKCKIRFETIELGGESDRVTCPRCGSDEVEKKFSLFSSSPNEGTSCRANRGFTRGFG